MHLLKGRNREAIAFLDTENICVEISVQTDCHLEAQ